ncbi:MAG: hypothetical protein ACE5HE_11835 [Phycisphaerae bacterium]
MLAVDFIGGGAVGASLLAAIWIALIRGETVSTEITGLTRTIQAAERNVTRCQGVRDRQHALLNSRHQELMTMGQLPEQPPVEEYFETLSAIATEHSLRVRSHLPLSPRRYPGLLELRYVYELSGTIPNITRFLRAVEQTDFWADVSYLNISQGNSQSTDETTQRVAALTISLFAAMPAAVRSEDK